MIPILYAKNETAFQNNGIGHLTDIISASVTEERNGAYEMVFTYPVTGVHFSDIVEGTIVKAKPNETSNSQLFRVYKTSRPIGGIVTYSAEHVSYDLRGLPCISYSSVGTTASAAMNAVFTACPIANSFSAWTDISSLHSMSITEPRSLRNFCGGQKGSVLDVFGGEFEWDNFTVKLHGARGSNTGVVLLYGKNLTSAKQERNIAETYTHFCPYAKNTDSVVTLTEKVIQLVNPEDIGHSRALTMDLTSEFGDTATTITEAMLRTKAQEYIAEHNLGVPNINLKVSFTQIWDTPEYSQFANFEHVRLCDTVTVRFSELGINASAKVVKTKYDVLKERYDSIELGTLKNNIGSTISEMQEEIGEGVTEIKTDVARQIDRATQAITGNSGGYVVHYPALNPSEILIMNTPSVSTATKVWRWNQAGLGYSSNGIEGPYGIAITADGEIDASYIQTGALSAIDIMACTITGGTLNINDKFIVDAQGNASVEGYVKATSGVIGGCSINNGTLEVPAANITGTLTAEQIDADGIVAEDVIISGSITATQGTFSGSVVTDTGIIENAQISDLRLGDALVSGDVKFAEGKSVTVSKLKGNIPVSDTVTVNVSNVIYSTRSGDTYPLKEVVYGTVQLSPAPAQTTSGWTAPITIIVSGYYTVIGDTSRRVYRTFSGNCNITSDGTSSVSFQVDMAKFDSFPQTYNPFVVTDISAGASTVTFSADSTTGLTVYIDGSAVLPTVDWSASDPSTQTQIIGSRSHSFYEMCSRFFTQVSDRDAKTNIEEYDERYEEFFDKLKPVRYKYKQDDTAYQCGMILQDVEEALEQSGLQPTDFAGYRPKIGDEYGALVYTEFISLLINEVQKLKSRVEELEAKENNNG